MLNRLVGWVERSETQHVQVFVGFRFAQPNLQSKLLVIFKNRQFLILNIPAIVEYLLRKI